MLAVQDSEINVVTRSGMIIGILHLLKSLSPETCYRENTSQIKYPWNTRKLSTEVIENIQGNLKKKTEVKENIHGTLRNF